MKEHRRPHTYTELPCPERSCAGLVRRPTVRGDSWVERCDGIAAHEWTVHRADRVVAELVAETDRPALELPNVRTITGTLDASQQWIDSVNEVPLFLPGINGP